MCSCSCVFLFDTCASSTMFLFDTCAHAHAHFGGYRLTKVDGSQKYCLPPRTCYSFPPTLLSVYVCGAPLLCRGYQADSFLYAMTTTYMLSVPLISNGLGGNQVVDPVYPPPSISPSLLPPKLLYRHHQSAHRCHLPSLSTATINQLIAAISLAPEPHLVRSHYRFPRRPELLVT